MHYSYLINPFRVYLRFPVLISMVLGCFGWDNNLVDIYKGYYIIVLFVDNIYVGIEGS